MNTKAFSAILATLTGTASILTATLGISPSAQAATTQFTCSARDIYIEVSRLNNGNLRYAAYNIPSNFNRPSLLLKNGTARRDQNGDIVYRFRNGNYLYAAVQDRGYGKVLVYKNNRLIATKYCGDV